MRYALRKQDKIKAVLGNEYLENNILQSLNKYFENSDNDRIYSDNLRWCTQKENMNYKPARRNKIKYNCQIVGYGADGKECVRFDNYIDAEKRGMYRHLIKKSVDTGKPYKGILYKEEK